ncbi:MAG: hypothetical protein LBD02_10565, partial [Christensenellaceae bacterium]|nr:hypothetical protein [Christensenellaceae bacterium]
MHKSTASNIPSERAARPLAEPVWQNTITATSLASLTTIINAAGGATTMIRLSGNITLNGSPINIPSGRQIKLTSTSGAYTLNANQASRVLSVASGATLYLQNITITGGKLTTENGAGIYNLGTVVMQSGATISNNQTGAVLQEGSQRSFGGGVYNAGTFTMESGTITSNSATYGGVGVGDGARGGGVYNASGGTFTMLGGVITLNSTLYNPDRGGSGGHGGGIYNASGGNVELLGGTISKNTATYSALSSGDGSYGGGVFNTGSLNLAGTVISGNSASGGQSYGGGIYTTITSFSSSVFTMSSGRIEGNDAADGGGVYVGGYYTYNVKSNFFMTGGEIVKNTASSYGGGVCIRLSGVFVLSNGTVSYNTAMNGGGIFKDPSGTLELQGTPLLDGNSATQSGGAIFLSSFADGTGLVIPSGARIINNSAGQDGGGIRLLYSSLPGLTVEMGAVFSGNTAAQSYNREPWDDALYFSHIFGTQWSSSLGQGYNNYDIAYQGSAAPLHTVRYEPNSPCGLPPIEYTNLPYGTPTPPYNDGSGRDIPSCHGYTFAGWQDQNGSIYYPGAMPPVSGDAVYTALWIPAQFTICYEPGTAGTWSTECNTARFGEYPPPFSGDPSSEHLPGYTFLGWEGQNGVFYPAGTPLPPIIGDSTYTAVWRAPQLPAEVKLSGQKYAQGAPLPAGHFNFGLFDQNGNLISTALSDASGNIA